MNSVLPGATQTPGMIANLTGAAEMLGVTVGEAIAHFSASAAGPTGRAEAGAAAGYDAGSVVRIDVDNPVVRNDDAGIAARG